VSAETAGMPVAAAAASNARARFGVRRRGKRLPRSTQETRCGGAATHFGKNERDQNCQDFCGLAAIVHGRLKGLKCANEIHCHQYDHPNENIFGARELVLRIRL
jgi:hypothetical protein